MASIKIAISALKFDPQLFESSRDSHRFTGSYTNLTGNIVRLVNEITPGFSASVKYGDIRTSNVKKFLIARQTKSLTNTLKYSKFNVCYK